MASDTCILRGCGMEYELTYAVRSYSPEFGNYIHGYRVDPTSGVHMLVVALHGITSFDDFEYTGDYVSQSIVMRDSANDLRWCNYTMETRGGTTVTLADILGPNPIMLQRGVHYGTMEEMLSINDPDEGQLFFVQA